MKRAILSAILFVGLLHCASAQLRYPQDSLHPTPPQVPEYVVFAGDTIRFSRADLYERMDRELISFCYMHSNSTLMLKRSKRYFSMVVPIMKANGIPEDLKYLMAIESNLDPKALSSAGAAGLWQFTKATAQTYSLEVNGEVDERYNIEKETVAACKYLNDSMRRFGDWMTVAASYNAGQAGIARRIEEQRESSAMDLLLREETSRYMFRILAAKLFFENPGAFGFYVRPDDMYPPLRFRTVEVNGAVESLVDFAKDNGTSYFLLKEANLWLRDSKLLNRSGKTYKILIPRP